MILDKEIKVKKNSNNVQYYTNLKYDVDADLNFLVRVEDLPKSSHASITVKCDLCGNEKIITYYSYRRNVENSEFNIYTCIKCSKIKSKKTNLNKYGTEYPIQNEIIKSKRKSNNIKKYGVDEPSKIKEVIDKIKVSKKLKYGDETYNNLEKNKNTKLKRYNNANYNNRLKSEATCIEKYEFKNVSMSDSIKEKKKLTFLKNFGVDNYSKSTSFQNQRIEYLKKLYQDIKIISVKDDNLLLKCDCNLNHSYEININILRNRILYKTILCSICNPINSYNSSGGEIQLQNFIKENYQGNIICNNRNIIHPYELDVYLPELKIAFEYNGLYWHSEVNKDSNFHLNKTIECSKKDIQLIHIFEDDWYYKENIIKSIILNFLKKSNKIYAKKCNVKEVPKIK